MAPNRRKGANKSTAARLKWKVGDLVLAKVKGFPAWPATVSEPQKWGYPADLKKVLVYFFGTQQIAFCNPGDIEEFTEEKKASLASKRHGKGSDFVRALNEIVACFEKLRKQSNIARNNITKEINTVSENNSDESSAKSVNIKTPAVIINHCCNGAINNLHSLTEAAATAEDTSHVEEMRLEEANPNSLCTETHTYLTRSKTDATQSQKVGAQRRMFAQKLRKLSRIEARGSQKSVLPSINNIRSSGGFQDLVFSDRALRRSKRVMKSCDDSEDNDTNSLASVFNDSNKDDGSEIMTVGSDTLSLNDSSTADSACKYAEIELSNEINERWKAELNDRLDFQVNSVILKKRRRLNRKRHRNPIDKFDEVISRVEVHKAECASCSADEKTGDQLAKEGGDDHLPLVKRARVRMGRSSPVVDDEVTFDHKEDETVEAPESGATESLGLFPADGDSIPTCGDPGKSSSLLCVSLSEPRHSGTGKNFVHSEAALPPSKRLHRALEAMSANVAEDRQITSNLPANMGFSSLIECSELSLGKAPMTLGVELEDYRNADSQPCSELCDVSKMEMLGTDGKKCSLMLECSRISPVEGTESTCLKLLPPFNDSPSEADGKHQDIEPDSTNNNEELSQFECRVPSLIRSDGINLECSKVELASKRSDPDSCPLQSDPVIAGNSTGGFHPMSRDIMDSADVGGVETDETGLEEAVEPKSSCSPEKNKDSQGSKVMEEGKPPSADSNTVLSATLVKAFPHRHCGYLFDSNSIPVECLEARAVSTIQSPTDAMDHAARTTTSTFVCKTSASENNSVEKCSSNSLDIQRHIGKAILPSKFSGKLESLSSFEAIIRFLTRTKESIGRATRVAIDCAKVGFASKVVETLAHNLESESSPPKKVDLFFLVDSITQCSGGMKGDAGLYPLEIQAHLPRLLLAAAPPGCNFYENHRQCLKVLRVWLDRKILPESIIRHHIRELDFRCGARYGVNSSRSLRFERPFDDPIREMEGMLVDEYGSNCSIQLPGFCMPPLVRDEDVGSDSDGESFEAVTPEHHVEHFDGVKALSAAVEKRSHILKDVDGELEMEDVAPCYEIDTTSSSNIGGTDCTDISLHQSDSQYEASFVSERPKDTNLLPATVSSSLLPPPPSAPEPVPVPPSNFPSSGHVSKICSRPQEPKAKRSPLPRFRTRAMDDIHYRNHENKDPEAPLPRRTPACGNTYSNSDHPRSRFSSRPNGLQPGGGTSRKGYHVHPPHPSPSNQFCSQQQSHSRRNIHPSSQPSRFHMRHTENGNFYRDHDRDKFAPRDDIGEYWRPHLPSISGPLYHDESRMSHALMSYCSPPRELAYPSDKWNFPPRSVNHRQYNHYGPSSGGPIPVANRGPNHWKSR
ncbi:protein HUA2-LIKE 3-like isoform X2 [Andrographis paniculata]|uniref:protein HUA2-LIKE 3-like isoform X2 n=1 Tax=Andrographis paniculata TaxID=175694 RepID=UPI0021E6E8E4|nr:protein HUA2-LIKE 3-like isoform X2 [Andrographis paniculata]